MERRANRQQFDDPRFQPRASSGAETEDIRHVIEVMCPSWRMFDYYVLEDPRIW